MALSDLAVFSEYAYEAMTEVLGQQVGLFNEASAGGIQLVAGSNQGDYSDVAFWKSISGLVRRRNAYGSGAQTAKTLQHLTETSVKVAAGTPPVTMPPSQFTWIKRNPEEGGAVYGQQLAKAAMADMLNTAILIGVAAFGGNANTTLDATAGVASLTTLNNGAAKFGDRSSELASWVMHSKSLFDIYGQAIVNANNLFVFGTVRVTTDGFGRPLVITDSPNLTYVASGTKYRVLGLVNNGIRIEQNDDFDQNIDTTNGDENIQRSIQSEWTYNASVLGYAWDKTNGGKSPTDAALGTATNWDKYASDDKDTGGVLIKVQ